MAVAADISRTLVTVYRWGLASVFTVLLVPMLAAPAAAAGADRLFAAIQAETELLRASGRVSYEGIEVLEPDLVAEIYERNRFAPLWLQPERIGALPAVIRSSHDDGLNPADYHLERIERVLAAQSAGRQLPARGMAVFDILLTDSLAGLVLDLRFGKIDRSSRRHGDGQVRPLDGLEPVLIIERLIESDELASMLTSVLPRSSQYLRLRAALQQYRRIADAGGWPLVPDGPTISPGSRDPRIPVLARRLQVTGDLPRSDRDFDTYDETLQAGVRRFQTRHGLAPDAEAGAATLRAMNVPVTARIDGIRLNLERARWAYAAERRDFMRVNVPAFEAYLVRDGMTTWSTKVIVGAIDTETPLFEAQLKYVVLNPTWTVPHGIASEELLPAIRNDPAYLSRGGYELFDRTGVPVDPRTVDWDRLGEDDFRFTLVQRPGPGNQMGRIKFVFPNEQAIFMHDTPAKDLFGRSCRAFSHGCIRVERPVELAVRLLRQEQWTRERIEAQIATGETRTVFLAEPLPVILVYWTATVDALGSVYFLDDVYARDSALLAALDATAR